MSGLAGLAWGLGGGLVGAVTMFVLHFLLLRKSQAQTDRASDRALDLAKRLDTSVEDVGQLEKAALIDSTNLSELRRELANKDTTIRELGARVDAVQKARDDLAEVLKQNPGAVTAAVSVAFDRLREEVSRAQAAATASTRDPRGGEAGPVHETTDVAPG